MIQSEVTFSDIFEFKGKSSRKASDGLSAGSYPFFTSSVTQSKYVNDYDHQGPCLIFGTGGSANVHYCQEAFATSTDCLVASVKKNRNDLAKYYYYYLRSNLHILEAGFRGAGLKHVSKGFIQDILCPVSTPSYQQKIVCLLDKADAIRRKRQESISLTEEFLRSVFLDMFGDPVTNPKGWDKKPLGDVCDLRLGKMLDAKQQTGKHLRFYLRNTNVQWGRFELSDLLKMDFNEKERKEFRLVNGDVLLCEGGEVGRAAVWRGEISECYFQKAIHRGRPHKGVLTSEYFANLMWFIAAHGGLKDHVTSATIAHLTGVKLKGMLIPIPPYTLQEKFENLVAKIKNANKKLIIINSYTDDLFNSLTQRAFRGEQHDL